MQKFVIRFKGGLGNQMFTYAFYCKLRSKYPHALFMFDIYNARQQHQGYELMRIFYLKHRINIFIFKLYQFLFHNYEKKFTLIQQSSFGVYDSALLEVKTKNAIFDGFWQTDLYFNDIPERIKEQFVFKESLLSVLTKNCMNDIMSKNTISVHIRRGDYLSFGVDMGSRMDYYYEAISHIRTNVSSPFFVFFSDDPQWVKEYFSIDSSIVVDWNMGRDCWQDMFLMSKCKHNIIANSSFSWWGGWLNNNPSKIVIAPKVWFGGLDEESICPNDWIQI